MTLNTSKLWIGGTPPPPALTDPEIRLHGHKIALLRKTCAILRAYLPLAPVARQDRPGAVTHRDEATVQSILESSLASLGVSLVVSFSGGENRSRIPAEIRLEPCRFAVTVYEAPLFNRSAKGSGIPCDLALEHVMSALNGLPLANGICGFDAFRQIGELQDGLQVSSALFTTALTIRPPSAYYT